jgi:hypothetical protein
MIRINYDENGRAFGLPDALSPQSVASIDVYSELTDLTASDDFSLSLSLVRPALISTGELTFTYGDDSTPVIDSALCTDYMIETALNDLDSITSAGGVKVSNFNISFNDIGARTAITIVHSALGALTGRVLTSVAGSVTERAIYRLDLKIQKLFSATTATNIADGSVVVTEITAGTVSAAQRDRITINRPPAYGKMRIDADGDVTGWLPAFATSYQIEMALEDAVTAGFLVSKKELGETVIIDVVRDLFGVNAAITVDDTFIWSAGINFSVDLTGVSNLLSLAGITGPVDAHLEFIHEGESKFIQPIRIEPETQSAGPII